jgi:hypothetical protein
MLVPNLIVINYPKPTSGANALTHVQTLSKNLIIWHTQTQQQSTERKGAVVMCPTFAIYLIKTHPPSNEQATGPMTKSRMHTMKEWVLRSICLSYSFFIFWLKNGFMVFGFWPLTFCVSFSTHQKP